MGRILLTSRWPVSIPQRIRYSAGKSGRPATDGRGRLATTYASSPFFARFSLIMSRSTSASSLDQDFTMCETTFLEPAACSAMAAAEPCVLTAGMTNSTPSLSRLLVLLLKDSLSIGSVQFASAGNLRGQDRDGLLPANTALHAPAMQAASKGS